MPLLPWLDVRSTNGGRRSYDRPRTHGVRGGSMLRRALLKLGVGVPPLAAPIPAAANGPMGVPSLRLVTLVAHPSSAARIGRAYLEGHPATLIELDIALRSRFGDAMLFCSKRDLRGAMM